LAFFISAVVASDDRRRSSPRHRVVSEKFSFCQGSATLNSANFQVRDYLHWQELVGATSALRFPLRGHNADFPLRVIYRAVI
jgi:hypothetical protein